MIFAGFPLDFPFYPIFRRNTAKRLTFQARQIRFHPPGDLLQTAQGELAKAHHRLDDPEGRLNRRNRLAPPRRGAAFDRAMAAARLRGLGAVAVKDG